MRLGKVAYGLALLGVGILSAVMVPWSDDYLTSRIKQLKPVTLANLVHAKTSNETLDLLIEGRISRKSVAILHDLVAYESARGVRDIRGEIAWVPDQKATPPLWLDLADGAVQIGGDYQLSGNLQTITEATMRYSGLSVGDAVIVIGKVMAGTTDLMLSADNVVRGTREQFLHRPANYLGLGIGSFLLLSGLASMGWLLHQGYSPFGNRETGRRDSAGSGT